MVPASGTPFPLGVMVGGPNGSDSSAQAKVDAQYNSFVRLLGATPQFMNGFVNSGSPIKDWPGDASWNAWSWRQSSIATNVIPVIGLPMATNADTNRRGEVYREFASGLHDAALRGVVEAWKGQGYSTLYIRPGYEMNGDYTPWYAGADVQTRSDWISAFRHIATVMRSVPGADVKIVWNPNIQAGNSGDVRKLYPGNDVVDVIAGDIYSPIYPRDFYNWEKNDGSLDKNFAEWVANPINRTHYWDYPAANQWNPISDGQSNTFSLRDMIEFARAQGKPIAIAETGAGGDGTRGPMDDPAFPKWLAATLQNAGVPIAFVNIWDLDPGDGDWDFSSPDANKPLEAAAWAKFFGAVAPGGTLPVIVGSGPDTIMLQLSEDAYQGDAQFTVSVDGKQVGGVQTVSASHAAGQRQEFSVRGTFGYGNHVVDIAFLNDAYGGSASTDRNLHVDSIGFSGTVIETDAGLYSNGVRSFFLPGAAATVPDTLVLRLSQDAFGAPAQFTVRLDGQQLGGVQSVTALHKLGQSQDFTFSGQFGPGPHSLAVAFINDAWGGSAATDRNLHLDGAEFNGTAVPAAKASLFSNGTMTVAIPLSTKPADTVAFMLSEDAWAGDALAILTLDGEQLGGVQVVTASHALGQPQRLAFSGNFGPGPHTATVSFINDAQGGPGKDRNLFVHTIEFNGHVTPASAALYWNRTAEFAIPAYAASATAASSTAALIGTSYDTVPYLPA